VNELAIDPTRKNKKMYGASNLELQTATDETLNVLTIQFDEFRTKAIATFKELGKKMQDLRKHVDKVENCQASLEERLMGLGTEQNQILRSITTLRKDFDRIGDRMTDANDRLENLERDSGDEATDSAASLEKNEQQSHGGNLTTSKTDLNDLQKSFDDLRKRFEHSEDSTLLLRTEVSHIKDRLGDSEEEFPDSESEGGSDRSDHAASLHEQDHSSLSGNRVDWTEKDERDLNDLLEKDWTTLKFFDDQPETVEEGETFEELEVKRDVMSLVKDELVRDKEPVPSGGAGAAGPVSGLDYPGKTRSHGQSGETTDTVSLQSSFSALDRLTESRSQNASFLVSCPRCLKRGHELRACPYKAETTYLFCCERWGKHSDVCRRQMVTRPSLESTTCPRCLQLGHRVRECPAEAVTQYLSCCKQWKLHRPGCVRALDVKK
jgi:predicted  nucleic acid-binding Zn-ribbon protein